MNYVQWRAVLYSGENLFAAECKLTEFKWTVTWAKTHVIPNFHCSWGKRVPVHDVTGRRRHANELCSAEWVIMCRNLEDLRERVFRQHKECQLRLVFPTADKNFLLIFVQTMWGRIALIYQCILDSYAPYAGSISRNSLNIKYRYDLNCVNHNFVVIIEVTLTRIFLKIL